MLLLDWRRFQDRRWWALYPIGALYMFLVNGLRITLLFLLGYWSRSPEADWLPRPARDTALALFHNNSGWILYLVAFAIFVHFVYRPPAQGKHTADSR
jgi:exosortase/archaeosortase family protein